MTRPYWIRVLGVAYAVLLVLALTFYLSNPHGQAVLAINQLRTPWLDAIMPLWTHFGDGWFFASASIILLILRWRVGSVFVLLGTTLGLLTAFLKRIVFHGVPRPKTYFAELGQSLEFIEGVKVHALHAFPSGHTLTAFGAATFLTLFTRKLWVGVTAFFVAISAGFSRIYLLQHFLIDVAIGSLIGVMVAVAIYYMFRGLLDREGEKLGLYRGAP